MQTQTLHTQRKPYSTSSLWVHQASRWVRKALCWHFRYQHAGIPNAIWVTLGVLTNATAQCEGFRIAVEYRL